MTQDTTTETVERLARFYEKTWGNDGWPSPISDTLRALAAERDALRAELIACRGAFTLSEKEEQSHE